MTHMTEQSIIDEVLRRLTLPRVGLLCDEAEPLPGSDAFTWVTYPRGGEKAPRVYPLPRIERPEDEGATLRLLVALNCPLTVVGELLDGAPRSSEGALILGCLGRAVPVLMQGSFTAWTWYGGTACGRRLASRLERLRAWGLHIIEDGPERTAAATEDEAGALILREPGWTTWRELDGRLAGVSSIRLTGGAKLTLEARERLTRLNIKVYE